VCGSVEKEFNSKRRGKVKRKKRKKGVGTPSRRTRGIAQRVIRQIDRPEGIYHVTKRWQSNSLGYEARSHPRPTVNLRAKINRQIIGAMAHRLA